MPKPHPFQPVLNEHRLLLQIPEQKSYMWSIPQTELFDELIISWNAERPLVGQYVILCSVLTQEWSPWLLYAVWGSQVQYSFHDTTLDAPVRSFQDQVELLDGRTASGYRIRVEASSGASLDRFYFLFGCTSLVKSTHFITSAPPSSSLQIKMEGLSQLGLIHPRASSMCSPTSTTAVIHQALGNKNLSPLSFAENVYDSGFDIYGHWPFNIAQAFVELGKEWKCTCSRVSGFDQIYRYLKDHLPLVVSIKGLLTGSLLPYKNGHLVVIRGFDAETNQILCMDPAFPLNEQTIIAYPWEEFLEAWKNRLCLTYFFSRLTNQEL